MDTGTPSPPESSTDQFSTRALNTKEAARFIGMSQSWLRKARIGLTDDPGPKFRKVGRKVIYPLQSLKDFLDG